MNGYIYFYKGKEYEVYAETTYAAQKQTAEKLKLKRSWEITVILAEKDGNPVIHSTSSRR